MADNFFIIRDFDWEVRRSSHLDRGLNLFAKRLGRRVDTAGFIDRAIRGVTGLTFPTTRSGISTNVEQRMNMYHLVSQTLAYKVEGDLVEVGCNQGQSSVLITKVMKSFDTDKKFHVYDSFEGLPETKRVDGHSYKQGDLATSEEVLRGHFSMRDLELPIIHKGWFDKTLPASLPDSISFAYLDGDLYDSIMISLKHVYPRLSMGAICLIDDYCDTAVNPDGWNYLPGVKRACDEFLKDKLEEICYVYSGEFTHGFFRKL
jgi:O-methyltransferase